MLVYIGLVVMLGLFYI